MVLRGTREPTPNPEPSEEPSAPPNPPSSDDSTDEPSTDEPSTDEPDTDGHTDDDSGSTTPKGVWDRLAECESGQQWDINTGNGYYGGLQFTAQTWRAYGGSGMAHNASREEQIRIAEKVLADVGWRAWPACSRKLGLR